MSETSISPTAHATILLTPTQKFMRAMLEIENAFDPTGAGAIYHACSSLHSHICRERHMYDECITEALDVYESFHVLEASLTR